MSSTKYEVPALEYLNLEMESFICESQVYLEVDELQSVYDTEFELIYE